MSAVDERNYGQLELGGDRPIVRYERRFPHPQAKVWRALTEDEQLEAWFPTTIEGERVTGAELTFRHRNVAMAPMEGSVLAFEPQSLLELDWGGDVLRFELRSDGDATVLTFTAIMSELGKTARDGAGWHVCLNRLGFGLEGAAQPPESDPSVDWRAINRVYIERFGPEAATVGPPMELEAEHAEGG